MLETQTPKKIHPHKFQLWIAFASIIMAFSGLISAYLVKMNQDNWLVYKLPNIFIYSTIVILLSSFTLYIAEKAYKQKNINQFLVFTTITIILGLLFIAMQITGFEQVQNAGVKLIWKGANASGSFLLVIAGLHIIHIVGGLVALLAQFLRAYYNTKNIHSAVEITAQYWHFVDVLWIVLFLFFILAKP